jgi:hypothetical protein
MGMNNQQDSFRCFCKPDRLLNFENDDAQDLWTVEASLEDRGGTALSAG